MESVALGTGGPGATFLIIMGYDSYSCACPRASRV